MDKEQEILANATWKPGDNSDRGLAIALARIDRLESMFAKLCDQMGLAYDGDVWVQVLPDRKIGLFPPSSAHIR